MIYENNLKEIIIIIGDIKDIIKCFQKKNVKTLKKMMAYEKRWIKAYIRIIQWKIWRNEFILDKALKCWKKEE